MEPDGFAYEGAAVYDLLEKKWLRVIGGLPHTGTSPPQRGTTSAPREDTETAAADRDLIGKEVTLEGRRFLVEKDRRGWPGLLRDLTFEGLRGFPIERVEHISVIRRLMGPAEKTAGPEKGVESSADGHDQGGKEPPLAPPSPSAGPGCPPLSSILKSPTRTGMSTTSPMTPSARDAGRTVQQQCPGHPPAEKAGGRGPACHPEEQGGVGAVCGLGRFGRLL